MTDDSLNNKQSGFLKWTQASLENFFISGIILPILIWGLICFIFTPADSDYTKKVLKAIWFLFVMFYLLNWMFAGLIKWILDLNGIRTFEEIRGNRRLFKVDALLELCRDKNIFSRYAIYYLVQFNLISSFALGWTIIGGFFVYILINRIH